MTQIVTCSLVCSLDEVLLTGFTEDKPPVVSQVEHVALVNLPPMLPLVGGNLLVSHLAVNVHRLSGDFPDTMFKEMNASYAIIELAQLFNIPVSPSD